MTSLTDNAKAAIVLTTRLGDRKRPALTALQWHRYLRLLEDEGAEPAAAFGDPSDDPRIAELVADGARVMFDLEAITQRGIWVVTEFDDDYPDRYRRLGDVAPPVLFGAGDRSLLDLGGIGVVGSRDVDESGAEVAKAVAREAVELGLPVVSGGARGVDRLAMNAAFTASGRVVGVLADSLDKAIRSGTMLRVLEDGVVCLITQQHPSTGFSPQSAYGRNKLIYGLADATVVVASAEGSGGTWKGAKEALGKGLGVLVWRGPGEGPGNAPLTASGAFTLDDVGRLGALLDDVLTGERDESRDPEQLRIV